MSDLPHQVPPLPIAFHSLDSDLPCARCGYNLRGLTLEMRCPECGTPTERSIYGNLLRYAEPGWVGKLARGVAIKLWNMLIGLVVGLGTGLSLALGAPPVLMMFIVITGGILGLWAIFLITAPEPMVGVQEDPVTLRKVVRVTAVAGMIGGVLSQSAHLGGPAFGWAVLGGLAFSLVGIAAMFGEFVYLRRFAQRMPNEKLVRNTTTVMWGYMAMYAAILVIGSIAAFTGFTMTAKPPATMAGLSGSSGFALLFTMMGFVGCGLFIAMFVFGIWYIVLLAQYMSAFKREAAAARAIYASDNPRTDSTPHP